MGGGRQGGCRRRMAERDGHCSSHSHYPGPGCPPASTFPRREKKEPCQAKPGFCDATPVTHSSCDDRACGPDPCLLGTMGEPRVRRASPPGSWLHAEKSPLAARSPGPIPGAQECPTRTGVCT